MSLGPRWIATCVLLFISEMLLPSGLHAQERAFGFSPPGRVVSAVEDSSADSISFQIRGKQPLPVPVIQYFPGADGQTVMAVDFPELVWSQPSSIIHPRHRLVEAVRIGQFQTNPPIFRISITTSNPAMLRKIDLRAEGGLLIVRFPVLEERNERNKFDVAETVNGKSRSTTRNAPGAYIPPVPPKRSNSILSSLDAEIARRADKSFSDKKESPTAAASELPTLRPAIAVAGEYARNATLSQREASPRAAAPRSAITVDAPSASTGAGRNRSDNYGGDRAPTNGTLGGTGFSPAVANRKTVAQKTGGGAPLSGDESAESVVEPPKRPYNPFSRLSAVLPPLAPSFHRRHPVNEAIEPPAATRRHRSGNHVDSGAESIGATSTPSGDSASPPDYSVREPTEKPLAPMKTRKSESPLAPMHTRKGESPLRISGADSGAPQKAPDYHQFSVPTSPVFTDFQPKLRVDAPASAPDRRCARIEPVDSKPTVEPSSEDPPSISFAGTQPLQVVVRGAGPIKYRSFRLSDPERFVVDFFEGAPCLNMNIPESPSPATLTAVRSGMPDGDSAVRIVLDLAKAGIAVKEELSSDRSSITLTLCEANFSPAFVNAGPGGPFTVVLDAGHGGSDPGAQRGDLREKDMTMGITNKLKRNLEARGMKVILTRSDDTFVSLEERVRITNSVKPDAFVSVHINSLESDSAISGIETYYQNDCSKALASKIHAALVGQLAVPDRSVRKARFYVVNHTPHPAILAEVGFISNKQEREKLMSGEYQGKVADALGQGIIFYLSESRNLARKGQDERKNPDQTSVPPARSGSASVIPHIFTR